VKQTWDKRPVHPRDAKLPEGASGWTMCSLLSNATYGSWIEPEDLARAKADLMAIREAVSKLHTRAAVEAAQVAAGMEVLVVVGPLASMQHHLELFLYARKWPLREA
jgi:hypothetical protein